MTPSRPYLIRAIHEWIVANAFTPYILVDANFPEVVVPRQFVRDGKIVLNLSPMAVQGLTLGNERIEFRARFSGRAMDITVPTAGVLAIYANENGQGMVFNEEEGGGPAPQPPTGGGRGRPGLKVVK